MCTGEANPHRAARLGWGVEVSFEFPEQTQVNVQGGRVVETVEEVFSGRFDPQQPLAVQLGGTGLETPLRGADAQHLTRD